jgi:hypothetical protein
MTDGFWHERRAGVGCVIGVSFLEGASGVENALGGIFVDEQNPDDPFR